MEDRDHCMHVHGYSNYSVITDIKIDRGEMKKVMLFPLGGWS